MPTDTALHEAGHAVAAVKNKALLDHVDIVHDKEKQRLGLTTATYHPEIEGLYSFAGYAAVFAYHEAQGKASPVDVENIAANGCGFDFEEAQEHCERFGLNYEQEKENALVFMREPATLAVVVRVGEELDAHETLSGDAVHLLIDIMSGDGDEQDWQDYLTFPGVNPCGDSPTPA